jgi:hypothetical protein
MYLSGSEGLTVVGVVMGRRQREKSSGLYEVRSLCSRKEW